MMKPLTQEYSIQTPTQKIIDLFAIYPEEIFSVSDIAKKARVSKPAVSSIIKRMQKEELITITKLNTIWQIQANRDNAAFKRVKILNTISKLYNFQIVDSLNVKYSNPLANILFGSARNGTDTSSSDIDIAIIAPNSTKYTIINYGQNTELQRRISIHHSSLDKLPPNLYNAIINGFILTGGLNWNEHIIYKKNG